MNIFETHIVTDSLEKLRALGKLDLDLKHRAARQGRNRGSPIKGFVKRKNTPLFKKNYFF